MKKLALLIGATHDELQGVENDIRKLDAYLKSIVGGAWGANEIETYVNCPLNHLTEHIDRIRKQQYDFIFTYWSGHGMYDTAKGRQGLEVEKGKILYEDYLFHLANRQLIIFDTCSYIPELAAQENLYELFSIEASFEDRDKARKYYEDCIRASDGMQLVYSCGVGEYSNTDDGIDSVYSDEIINQAKKWYAFQFEQSFLTIKKVTKLAGPKCEQYGQHPRVVAPKLPHSYPFAIKI